MTAAPERGFALLIVLWTLVLVTLLVTHLNATGRGEAQLARNLRDAAATEAAADGAVYEAAWHLLDGSGRQWVADRRPYELRLPQAVAVVRIEDEAGKIDPNSASLALLTALLHAVGADARGAAAIAGAIVDWRFPGGQEDRITAAYRTAGLAYRPPAAPFRRLDEIGLVLGMTPELLALLVPHLTVFHEGDPDPRAADPVVAAAIGAQTGAQILPPAGDRAGRIVTIRVDATGPGGSRFARRATLRLGADPGARAQEGGAQEGGAREGGAREGGAREGGVQEGGGQDGGGVYRILAWE